MAVKQPGKKLEGELGPALKHLGCFDYNSNDPHPACDRIVHWRGHGILMECKETRDGKLPESRFEGKAGRERRYLNWHAGLPDPDEDYPGPPTPPHGLTVAIVQLVSARPRTWVARWQDVRAMYEAAPVKHLVFPPSDPRWIEVFRVQRPHSLGTCWGLEGALLQMLEANGL